MEFFTGQREIARFRVTNGKSRSGICSIYEEWKPLLKESVRCGASSSCRVTKRLGVSQKEITSLEESVKSKLGVKTLAELEATIKECLKQENVWSESTETERKIEFSAPECGRYDIEQYQLYRTVELILQKKRYFRKPDISKSEVYEALHVFSDNSKVTPNDDNCNCLEPPEEKTDGYFIGTVGNLSFNVPYTFIKEGISLLFGSSSIELVQSDQVGATINIPTSWLTEYLIFLADLSSETVEVILEPKTKIKQYYRPNFFFDELNVGYPFIFSDRSLPMSIHIDFIRNILDRDIADD